MTGLTGFNVAGSGVVGRVDIVWVEVGVVLVASSDVELIKLSQEAWSVPSSVPLTVLSFT